MPPVEPVRVLFDATRLLARGGLATPTGIDRVDFEYVVALGAAPDVDLRLISFDGPGPRVLQRDAAAKLVESVRTRWSSPGQQLASHPAFERIRAWLESPLGARPASQASNRQPHPGAGLRRAGAALSWTLGAIRPSLPRTTGPQIYVNTSHGKLYHRAVPRWLGARRIRGVFFVHDLIPVQFPEFHSRGESERHALRIQTVGRHAKQVIVNSAATQVALTGYLRDHDLPIPPIAVLHLGVEDHFSRTHSSSNLAPTVPYFVMLGTLEPRKNHLLVLQVWRQLLERLGAKAPRLVLIGRRGWDNQAVFNMLDRVPALSRLVAECSGLGDIEIAALLRGARALLAPSFSEGFGMPVTEALAVGTPVIASKIAAHLEVGGDCTEYLDPIDGTGWLAAIEDYAADPSERRARWLQRLQGYSPPSWKAHLASALTLIRSAAA